MDPLACLISADQSLTDGDIDEARQRLTDYREWRAKGGYEPIHLTAYGMNGDLLAEWIVRRIEDWN